MSKKEFVTIVPASPKVRKFARELGVDINKIEGSERDGRVIEDDIKLVEKNATLIKVQKKKFNNFNLNISNISWSKDLEKNYKTPIIVIANEFFDCFPIQQFYKKNDDWYEKMIKFDNNKKKISIIDSKVKKEETLQNIRLEYFIKKI